MAPTTVGVWVTAVQGPVTLEAFNRLCDNLDPESGALFVFASKRGNRLKVLWFDHNGYCLLYKRLHHALFELPEATTSDRPLASIDARTLAAIVRGVAK